VYFSKILWSIKLNYFFRNSRFQRELLQYKLGACYYKGKGIEKNLQKAKEYLNLAAAQGDKDAKKLLEKL